MLIAYKQPQQQNTTLQECSVFRRCSPRSHPNTRSRTIPVRLSCVRAGREVKKVRRNDINLPRFRKTETNNTNALDKTLAASHAPSLHLQLHLTQLDKNLLQFIEICVSLQLTINHVLRNTQIHFNSHSVNTAQAQLRHQDQLLIKTAHRVTYQQLAAK